MIIYVKESELILYEHPMNILKGNYFNTVEDTQNLTTEYRKASRRGFKIRSYMLNFSVKQALANLLYP